MIHDFFVAYASPDRAAAEELSWYLEDLDRSYFFDAAHIPIGGRWDEVLKGALAQSRVVVVLVSEHSAAAHYEQDEIVRAIQLSRSPDRIQKTVPVLLDQIAYGDMPYGLAALQPIEAGRAGGLKRVAKVLHDSFPPEVDAKPPVLRSAYDLAGVALRLDRTKQWNHILEASHLKENSLFTFHGDRRQNVGLFVSRVEHFFAQQIERPYLVRRIPFNIGGATPKTGDDWLGHLRAAFDCTGPLARSLRTAGEGRSLLAVLCDAPLPASELRPEHATALEQFLTASLPALLAEMNAVGALSVLVTLDYEGSPPALIDQVIGWCHMAEQTGWPRYRSLPAASLPNWDEVSDYVSNQFPRPTSARLQSIRERFEQIASQPQLSFQDMARFIETSIMLGD